MNLRVGWLEHDSAPQAPSDQASASRWRKTGRMNRRRRLHPSHCQLHDNPGRNRPTEPPLTAVTRKTVALMDPRQAQQDARRAIHAALKAADVQALGPALSVWRTPQGGTID